jgi:sirohydrochlorin cobaltochelatase
VPHDDFSDAALILVGHGSTKNADSEKPVYQHAAELRRRRVFREVREAFWQQEPKVADVLAGVSAPRVFIVPLFISEGYFSDQIIPQTLGLELTHDFQSRLRFDNARKLHYCRSIGTHDSMTGVLLARAQEVVARFPFPRAPKPKDISLFLAAHGTPQTDESRKSVDRQVELIRARAGYACVHSIFMEEDPRIDACYTLATTRNIVVVPFFISDGMHTNEDIPILLGEPERLVRQRLAAGQPTWRNPSEKKGKLIWYASAVGTEPLIADVILERVQEFSKGSI